jgi:hypothetical protein
MQSHGGPIDRDDHSRRAVTNSRNLKWKQIVIGIVSCQHLDVVQISGALFDLHNVVVRHEFAIEAAHHHDFVWAELTHA